MGVLTRRELKGHGGQQDVAHDGQKNKNQLGGFLMRKQTTMSLPGEDVQRYFAVSSFAISPPKTLTATSHLLGKA